MSRTSNKPASSTEPSVLGEDMALKPFSYYSFMDTTGIAERRLNGIRVDRNIPPFALLCASTSAVSPIPRLADFLGEHPRYEMELRDISRLLGEDDTGEHPGDTNASFSDAQFTPTMVSPKELMPQPEKVDLRNIPGRTIYNTGIPRNTDLRNIPGRTIYSARILTGTNIAPLMPSSSVNVPPVLPENHATAHGPQGSENSGNTENQPL